MHHSTEKKKISNFQFLFGGNQYCRTKKKKNRNSNFGFESGPFNCSSTNIKGTLLGRIDPNYFGRSGPPVMLPGFFKNTVVSESDTDYHAVALWFVWQCHTYPNPIRTKSKLFEIGLEILSNPKEMNNSKMNTVSLLLFVISISILSFDYFLLFQHNVFKKQNLVTLQFT